jgi:hypothetical protein
VNKGTSSGFKIQKLKKEKLLSPACFLAAVGGSNFEFLHL